MNIYEVSATEQLLVRKLFHGYVFRRTEDNGKHWIKLSKGQEKRMSKFLPFIKLINPVQS